MSEVSVTKSTPNAPAFGWPRWMMPFSEGIFGASPLTLMRQLTDEAWPAVECKKSNGTFLVTAEVPGMKKDEVKVEISGESLILEGERKMETKEEKDGWFRTERHYGKFYRAIPLPDGAEYDRVNAELSNGILSVKIPIVESKPKAKTIPVTEAKG